MYEADRESWRERVAGKCLLHMAMKNIIHYRDPAAIWRPFFYCTKGAGSSRREWFH